MIEGDITHCDTDIILGDPARIAVALQQADAEANTEKRSLSRLRWVQSTFAGVNAIVQSNSRDDYVLTRTCGFGSQMAEYCMGWILYMTQKVETVQRQQRQKVWDSEDLTHRGGLKGKTVGILGVGEIGSAVAGAAKAFNMKTIGLCSSTKSADSNSDPNFIKVKTLPRVYISLSHTIIFEGNRNPSRSTGKF